MIVTFRYAGAALIFGTVAASSFVWGLINHFLACGFALVASLIAVRCIDRAFVNIAHREMARIYGADWGHATIISRGRGCSLWPRSSFSRLSMSSDRR